MEKNKFKKIKTLEFLLVLFEKELTPKSEKEFNIDKSLEKTIPLWWFTKNWIIKHPTKKFSWYLRNPVKLWQVSLEKEDFETRLHIHPSFKENFFLNKENEKIFQTDTTRLSKLSQIIFKKRQELLKIKSYNEGKLNWIIVARKKEGPFMILDGNHRAINFYIDKFITKKTPFQPVTNVLCGICGQEGIKIFDLIDKAKP